MRMVYKKGWGVLILIVTFGFTRELYLTRRMKMNQQFSVTDKRLK
jgi:hypothetical protein